MARITLKLVNEALKAKGYKVELVKGSSYFYFSGEDTEFFESTSVLTPRLSDMSIEDWVEDYEAKLEESKDRRN